MNSREGSKRPIVPIFAGNIVDSSKGATKRIRRNVPSRTFPVRSGPGATEGEAAPVHSAFESCDPWVRMCQSVLPWKILFDIERSSAEPSIEVLPLLYKTADEYISKWEAAALQELKASVISNISPDIAGRGRKIRLTEIRGSSSDDALSKLSYVDLENEEVPPDARYYFSHLSSKFCL